MKDDMRSFSDEVSFDLTLQGFLSKHDLVTRTSFFTLYTLYMYKLYILLNYMYTLRFKGFGSVRFFCFNEINIFIKQGGIKL